MAMRFKPGSPGIYEDEEVTVPGVGPRRRDVGRERVVVELFVHHDPHRDVVLAHHRQDGGVPLLEPRLADDHLLRRREQARAVGQWRLRLGRGDGQHGEEHRPEAIGRLIASSRTSGWAA